MRSNGRYAPCVQCSQQKIKCRGGFPCDRCFDIGLRCKARPPPPPSPPSPLPPLPPSPEGTTTRRRRRRRGHFSSNRRSSSSTLTDARTRVEEKEDDWEGGRQEEEVAQTPFQEMAFTRNDPMKQVPFFLAAFHRLHAQGLIDRDRVVIRLRLWQTWSYAAGRDVTYSLASTLAHTLSIAPTELERPSSFLFSAPSSVLQAEAIAKLQRMVIGGQALPDTRYFQRSDTKGQAFGLYLLDLDHDTVLFSGNAAFNHWVYEVKGELETHILARHTLQVLAHAACIAPDDRSVHAEACLTVMMTDLGQLPLRVFLKCCLKDGEAKLYLFSYRQISLVVEGRDVGGRGGEGGQARQAECILTYVEPCPPSRHITERPGSNHLKHVLQFRRCGVLHIPQSSSAQPPRLCPRHPPLAPFPSSPSSSSSSPSLSPSVPQQPVPLPPTQQQKGCAKDEVKGGGKEEGVGGGRARAEEREGGSRGEKGGDGVAVIMAILDVVANKGSTPGVTTAAGGPTAPEAVAEAVAGAVHVATTETPQRKRKQLQEKEVEGEEEEQHRSQHQHQRQLYQLTAQALIVPGLAMLPLPRPRSLSSTTSSSASSGGITRGEGEDEGDLDQNEEEENQDEDEREDEMRMSQQQFAIFHRAVSNPCASSTRLPHPFSQSEACISSSSSLSSCLSSSLSRSSSMSSALSLSSPPPSSSLLLSTSASKLSFSSSRATSSSSFPDFSSSGSIEEGPVWREQGEGADAVGNVEPSAQLDRGGGGQDGQEEGLESEGGGMGISGGAIFVPVLDEELLERIFD